MNKQDISRQNSTGKKDGNDKLRPILGYPEKFTGDDLFFD